MLTDQHFLIVPASGVGNRMKTDTPKQHLMLNNGLSVLEQTLKTLLALETIKACVVVVSAEDNTFAKSTFAKHPKLLATTIGGKQRLHSVIAGLDMLKPVAKDNDWVLVHDGVRPCVKASEVMNLITQLKRHPTGGLLATPVVDTIKQASGSIAKTTLDRAKLWQAQTPQMYRFGVLSAALAHVIKNNISITDEASSIEHLGLESVLIPASTSNLKITTPEDLALANFYLTPPRNDY